jgi:dimethylargininase
MPIAITREINDDLNHGELTFMGRVPIDVKLARHQHRQYRETLQALGCELVSLPTAPALADSVFIEDTALVLDEIAVLCRPGARSRRAEVAAVADTLRANRDCIAIKAPGTVEGGDLLRCGKTIYAGLSTRTNAEGIRQLRNILGRWGYAVRPVPVQRCLHLKSAVSTVAEDRLLLNPEWVQAEAFENIELIKIVPGEAHAANALYLQRGVVYPSSFPRTLEKLGNCGINVWPVDVSELQKAEGAVTCCSLILRI